MEGLWHEAGHGSRMNETSQNEAQANPRRVLRRRHAVPRAASPPASQISTIIYIIRRYACCRGDCGNCWISGDSLPPPALAIPLRWPRDILGRARVAREPWATTRVAPTRLFELSGVIRGSGSRFCVGPGRPQGSALRAWVPKSPVRSPGPGRLCHRPCLVRGKSVSGVADVRRLSIRCLGPE